MERGAYGRDTARAMSEENVETVRQSVDAYLRGDIEKALSYIDPDAELHSAIIGGAEGSSYGGHEGFRRWYADTFEVFENLRMETNEVRDLGDRVLLLGNLKARGRESGVKIESPTGWIYTFRSGKILKADGFLSHAETLDAAGLSE
jgi:ketosteroid isomerase-like protein